MPSKPRADQACPCGLPASYAECCGRWHAGDPAPTAELLMRSRYTAFVVADAAYLLRTWDPRTAPPRIHFDPEQRWLGLRILGSTAGGLLDATGTVSFRATYRLGTSTDLGASTDAIRENSQFRRHDGRWVYVGPAG